MIIHSFWFIGRHKAFTPDILPADINLLDYFILSGCQFPFDIIW